MKLCDKNKIMLECGITSRQMLQDTLTYEIYDERQKEILNFIINLPPNQSLLFVGPSGTGKDMFATIYAGCQVFNDNLKNFFSGNLQALFRQYRDAAFGSNRDEVGAFKKLCGYEMLILRDVGTRDLTDFERTLTIDLIDYYYETNRSVIITTNCLPGDLKKTLDPRIVDRLREMTTLYQNKEFIPCVWESYRPKRREVDPDLQKLLTLQPINFEKQKLKSISFCDVCETYTEFDCNCDLSSNPDIPTFCREHYTTHWIPENIKAENYQEMLDARNVADERYRELLLNFEKKHNLK